MLREGERLTALVNDMLDLAKIESGRMQWRMEPLRPHELVARAARSSSGLFTQPDVTLRVDAADALPEVDGDADWLQQVLVNLLSNAAKFTESGEVVMRARAVGSQVEFAVRDSGSGIPEDQVAHIFEKFAQVDGAHRTGTGLGLPICREIVAAHGGVIGCESEVGVGSTFWFRLPRARGESATVDAVLDP